MIPIVRLPSLLGDFLGAEESLLLLLARQINDGAILYSDVWYAGPPLLVWGYTFVDWIFGTNSLFVIRILTCLYIYISAVYFNGILVSLKPFQQSTGAPAIIFVLLTSVPWYSQELSASLALLFPVIGAFHALIQLDENFSLNFRRMFRSGLFWGIAIMVAYKAFFLWLAALVVYISFRRARLDEFISLLAGTLLSVLAVGVALFTRGNLTDFWDVGLLYYFDRIFAEANPFYEYDPAYASTVIGLTWAGFVFLAIMGITHFRLRFFSYLAKIRGLEIVLFFWLIGVITLLIFKWNRVDLSDFALFAPLLAFYMTKALEFKVVSRFRVLILGLCMAIPVYQYVFGYILVDTSNKESLSNTYLSGKYFERIAPYQNLAPVNDNSGKNPNLIMAHLPEWYIQGGVDCPNKYADFRIVYFKFEAFHRDQPIALLSKPESEREIFLQFSDTPPEMVIDPFGLFQSLVGRFPILENIYVEEKKDSYRIYRQKH